MEAKRVTGQTMLGAKLRQAREGRGLSIDDAAQALRLSARIVAALEDDAFDRLPGPTYARGYLRNYAQFLGLSPQPLIDAYNNLPEASQRTDMTALTPARETTSSDILVRLGTVAVAVVVLGLAALWWSGHDAGIVLSRAPAPTTETTAEKPSAPDVREATGAPDAAPESTPEPVGGTAAEAPTPAAPPVDTAKPEPTPAPTPKTAAIEPSPAPSPALNVPPVRLVLYVREDSWADVRDGQQRRLLYETIPAGRVVTVEGVPPLSVFLGNVEGVDVEFNGQPYDAMRYKRGQVARFTLGSPPG